ncbi:MAG: 50S ribosomal protein L15 [Candidatus Magasanikbacteria bacterium]|nr:50S ribosomal protein L15 [Candidatus Magasanikbacteria bacterium]
MLQPHTLHSAHGAKHKVKRIGRGNASGHGTSATRGGKGQTARSGGSRGLARLAFKRQLQSAPKLRGFKSLRVKPVEIYLSDLEKHFASGDIVTVAVLKEKKLVGLNDATAKVIGAGELTKKLTLQGIATTKSVAEKITAVGGEIK